jgi:hypothetical protein
MSIYSDISKKIGHVQGKKVDWPTKERALQLLTLVQESDLTAFEEVFTIYRYAICCSTEELVIIAAIITDAFIIGLAKWGK